MTLRPPLSEVRGISKTFASRWFSASGLEAVAAKDVSFRLDRRGAVALVGETGSANNPLARLFLRLEHTDRTPNPATGSRDVAATQDRPFAPRAVGGRRVRCRPYPEGAAAPGS